MRRAAPHAGDVARIGMVAAACIQPSFALPSPPLAASTHPTRPSATTPADSKSSSNGDPRGAHPPRRDGGAEGEQGLPGQSQGKRQQPCRGSGAAAASKRRWPSPLARCAGGCLPEGCPCGAPATHADAPSARQNGTRPMLNSRQSQRLAHQPAPPPPHARAASAGAPPRINTLTLAKP